MMERLGKKPAYLYAKDFSLSQVLGNLQAYKVVTGQVSEELRGQSGESKEVFYGNLIRNAGVNRKRKGEQKKQLPRSSSGYEPRSRQGSSKRTCQTGLLYDVKEDNDEDEEETKIVWSTSTASPRSCELKIPESILAYGSGSSTSDEDSNPLRTETAPGVFPGSHKDTTPKQETVEEEDGEFENDFFGLKRIQHKSEDWERSDPAKAFSVLKGLKKRNPKSSFVTIRTPYEKSLARTEQDKRPTTHRDLSTVSCTNCKRRGHVAMHCTVGQHREGPSTQKTAHHGRLTYLFAQCRELREAKNRRCAECGVGANLAHCMECNTAYCDGSGHLRSHLLMHPMHSILYSYKLQRILKCQNPRCDVTSIYDLITCRHCLDKSFRQHYSMLNATWSRTGLRNIPNSIACEEHFLWHRMNCGCDGDETLVSVAKLESISNDLLSEFYF